MKILDLYCGAGGVSTGLFQAGITEITGVDINPQPEYPSQLTFIQADVTKLKPSFLKKFDFIWSSPPCQNYSFASAKARNLGKVYPDLVVPTRNLLLKSKKPFVMENVIQAPIRQDLLLCGEMFGLGVIRHRKFEIHGFKAIQPVHKKHRGKVSDGFYVTVAGHGGDGKASLKSWQDGMQIHWMKNKKSLAESIPPAYSKYIIEQFLKCR